MKALRDGNVWFVIGMLIFISSFVVAMDGASNLAAGLAICISIVAFVIGLVLNAQNAKANRS